jgi:hypothetical protein
MTRRRAQYATIACANLAQSGNARESHSRCRSFCSWMPRERHAVIPHAKILLVTMSFRHASQSTTKSPNPRVRCGSNSALPDTGGDPCPVHHHRLIAIRYYRLSQERHDSTSCLILRRQRSDGFDHKFAPTFSDCYPPSLFSQVR